MAVPGVVVFILEGDSSQDCIDHIHLRHHVGLPVKTANLGKWFPPWTVMCTALQPNVSGISTDVVLFSEHGPSWSTTNRCMATGCPMALCVELSWPS